MLLFNTPEPALLRPKEPYLPKKDYLPLIAPPDCKIELKALLWISMSMIELFAVESSKFVSRPIGTSKKFEVDGLENHESLPF